MLLQDLQPKTHILTLKKCFVHIIPEKFLMAQQKTAIKCYQHCEMESSNRVHYKADMIILLVPPGTASAVHDHSWFPQILLSCYRLHLQW